MAKVSLNPQFGTRDQSKQITAYITDISENNGIRIKVENATCSTTDEYEYWDTSSLGADLTFDLNISENNSQSAFSIFFYIEKKDQDGEYILSEILSTIYYIQEEKGKEFDGNLQISPSFVSVNDLCAIEISSSNSKKTIFSINDKRLPVHINDSGGGSIHFKASDVLESKDISTVQKLPVYFYSEEDNYVRKNFTGSYIHVVPESIVMHADFDDPRCDPNDARYIIPGSWILPDFCKTPTIDEGVLGPEIPPLCIPSSDEEGSLGISNHCRVHSASVALLNSGMIMHAYTSIDSQLTTDDDAYNISKVFVKAHKSTVDRHIIATMDVVVAPKTSYGNFEIYTNNELWDYMGQFLNDPSINDVMVLLYDELIGYQCINIIGRTIDEYTASNILIGDAAGTNVEINSWLFCVKSVFYHGEAEPSAYPLDISIPYITDDNGNYLQAINVAVGSNQYYFNSQEEMTNLYLVAEAFVENYSQLFFYSFTIGADSEYSSTNYGWVQLTNSGHNKNPKIFVDKNDTLSVLWESDRTGHNQIYYGILGSNSKSLGNAAFASILDKYAEFQTKSEQSFTHVSSSLLKLGISDEYNPVPEYTTSELVDGVWTIQQADGGIVTDSAGDSFLDDLSISVNPVSQSAIAFMPLQIVDTWDNTSDLENPYLQYNYQVSFDLNVDVTQTSSLMDTWDGTVLSSKDIDNLFSEWKAEFDVSVDVLVSNVPIYTKNNNKFVLGKQDTVFNKFVPTFGSYKGDFNNPSEGDFDIRILQNDNNLKDFCFGLMMEKTYFQATNIETFSDFSQGGYSSSYVSEETHEIYTGRAKFIALVKTEDQVDEKSNYTIIKEFPEIFELGNVINYKVIINYTKIGSDEVVNLLDLDDSNSFSNRYIGRVALLMDEEIKFSQSFVSEISSDYNYFDLGFGVPLNGYYAADKMYPSKLTVYENADIDLTFTDIVISSPTYTYNDDISSLPDTTSNMAKLNVVSESVQTPTNDLTTSTVSYDNSASLLNLGYRSSEKIEYTSTLYSSILDTDYNGTYDVTDIDRITVDFQELVTESRIRITTIYDYVLYNSGYISASAMEEEYINFDVDVTNYTQVKIQIDGIPEGITEITYPEWAANVYWKTVYDNSNFVQIPITIEGINQSLNIANGDCNDINIVWQSNRNHYWDIFTSNSVNKFRPFRFETKISETDSNSISPSIAIARNGKRLITWHDNRNGDFDIYSARSLEGYPCDKNKCRIKILEDFEEEIEECVITFDFTASYAGLTYFTLEFYNDSGLTHLFKSISTTDGTDGWYINSVVFDSLSEFNAAGTVEGIQLTMSQEVTVSYTPKKGDGIFDRVLHIKLVGINI